MRVEVTMRALQPSDWRRLKAIRLFALRTEPGVFFSTYAPEAAASDDHWQSLTDAAGDERCIFGAFDGDELVGITAVFTDRNDPSGRTAALGMTYLLPAYRGRGLSALYFETRLRWARERPQFVRVAVSHRRSNDASRRAIERYGFARTGAVERTWPDGVVEDEVKYELPLLPAEVSLVELRDDDFAEMLRGAPIVRPGLATPPGGVDDPVVVSHVQRIVTQLRAAGHDAGNWMIVAGGEVVGLGGFKGRPSPEGEVEIGYSIAASRRRRGHMTRAVALIVEAARRDPAIRAVIADTAVDNVASHGVLANNGFERVGTRADPLDGPLLRWRKRL